MSKLIKMRSLLPGRLNNVYSSKHFQSLRRHQPNSQFHRPLLFRMTLLNFFIFLICNFYYYHYHYHHCINTKYLACRKWTFFPLNVSHWCKKNLKRLLRTNLLIREQIFYWRKSIWLRCKKKKTRSIINIK